jgi:hypothetical protein
VLISLKYNFALLAMPKCGSTALHAALARHAQIQIGGSPALKHTPFRALESYILPFITNQTRALPRCEPFSLFREPLHWLFSWYSYRGRPELAASGEGSRGKYIGEISFSDFLNEHFKKKPPSFANFRRQSFFIEDNAGGFGSVTLYRYEDIAFLVQELERRIGKRVQLSEKNVSPKRSMELSSDQIAEARTILRVEYEIYSSIVERGQNPTT